MGALPSSPISVADYLRNPAYAHCELVDGRPVELQAGNERHSRIQLKCARKLDEYFDGKSAGRVYIELHCRLDVAGHARYRLPDVAVVLAPRFDDEGHLIGSPDLVVEVRSPGESIASQTPKIEEYLACGATLAWLLLPEEQSVLAFAPGIPVQTLTAGQTLTGGGLLPDLRIPIDYLFS